MVLQWHVAVATLAASCHIYTSGLDGGYMAIIKPYLGQSNFAFGILKFLYANACAIF